MSKQNRRGNARHFLEKQKMLEDLFQLMDLMRMQRKKLMKIQEVIIIIILIQEEVKILVHYLVINRGEDMIKIMKFKEYKTSNIFLISDYN